MILLLFIATLCNATTLPTLRGEVVWNSDASDGGRIVVEKITAVNDKGRESGLIYRWYYSRPHSDEKICIYSRPGDFSGIAGMGVEVRLITILSADILNGRLVTVFNQNWTMHGGRVECWAFAFEFNAEGRITGRRPDEYGSTTFSSTAVVGTEMKSGKLTFDDHGVETLCTVDLEGKLHKFSIVDVGESTLVPKLGWKEVELASPTWKD